MEAAGSPQAPRRATASRRPPNPLASKNGSGLGSALQHVTPLRTLSMLAFSPLLVSQGLRGMGRFLPRSPPQAPSCWQVELCPAVPSFCPMHRKLAAEMGL